jgi:hypothetical protein
MLVFVLLSRQLRCFLSDLRYMRIAKYGTSGRSAGIFVAHFKMSLLRVVVAAAEEL